MNRRETGYTIIKPVPCQTDSVWILWSNTLNIRNDMATIGANATIVVESRANPLNKTLNLRKETSNLVKNFKPSQENSKPSEDKGKPS